MPPPLVAELNTPEVPLNAPIEAENARADRSTSHLNQSSRPTLQLIYGTSSIEEIKGIQNADDLALWTHRRFAAKNTLTAKDAEAVELAYLQVLKASHNGLDDPLDPRREIVRLASDQSRKAGRALPLWTN